MQIDRVKRRIAHGVFLSVVIRPLASARDSLKWSLNVDKEGYTPGERKYLEETVVMMDEALERCHKIYARLKV